MLTHLSMFEFANVNPHSIAIMACNTLLNQPKTCKLLVHLCTMMLMLCPNGTKQEAMLLLHLASFLMLACHYTQIAAVVLWQQAGSSSRRGRPTAPPVTIQNKLLRYMNRCMLPLARHLHRSLCTTATTVRDRFTHDMTILL